MKNAAIRPLTKNTGISKPNVMHENKGQPLTDRGNMPQIALLMRTGPGNCEKTSSGPYKSAVQATMSVFTMVLRISAFINVSVLMTLPSRFAKLSQ